jgi:TP901 family phage tail tape measure protein
MKDQIYETADGLIVFRTAAEAQEQQLNKNISLTRKFQAINDSLITTFRLHQVEMDELNDGLKYSIATANAMGVSFTTLSAALATLNDHLIKAGIAGRSLQSMLSRIARSPREFAEAFNVAFDPNKPLDLVDVMRQVNENLGDGTLTVDQIGVAFERMGLRGAKTFITLAQNVEEFEDNIRELEYASEDAAKKMAEVMLATPLRAFGRLWQTILQGARIAFEPIIVIITVAANAVADLFTWLGKINDVLGGIPRGILVFASWAITITALTVLVGVLIEKFVLLGGAILALAASEKVAAILVFSFDKVLTVVGAVYQAVILLSTAFKATLLPIIIRIGAAIATFIGGLSVAAIVIGGIVAAIAVFVGAIVSLVAWLFKKKKADEEAKKAVEEHGVSIDEHRKKAMLLVASTNILADSIDNLRGIRLSDEDMDRYLDSFDEMAVILDNLHNTQLGRNTLLGKELSINDAIVESYERTYDRSLSNLKNIEAIVDESESMQEAYEKAFKAVEDAAGQLADAYDRLIEKQRFINELAVQFAQYNFLGQMVENVRTGSLEAATYMEEFSRKSDEATQRASLNMINYFNQGFQALIEKGKPTVAELVQYFQNVNAEAQKLGPALVNAVSQAEQKMNDARKATQGLTDELNKMTVDAVNGLAKIQASFGLGVDEALKLEKETRSLGDAAEDARKEYLRMLADPEATYDQALQSLDKYRDAQDKFLKSQELSNGALEKAMPLFQQQQDVLKQSIDVSIEAARAQAEIAKNEQLSADKRDEALQKQQQYLNEVKAGVNEEFQMRSKLLDIDYQRGIVNETQYRDRREQLAKENIGAIKQIEDQLLQAQRDRIQLSVQNQNRETEAWLNARTRMKEFQQAIQDTSQILQQVKWEGFFDQIRSGFEGTDEYIKNTVEAIDDLGQKLEELTSKKHVIEIEERVTERRRKAQFGGLISNPSTVMVSAGEGYVPPGIAKHNLAALQAINQGLSIPARFPIGTFTGPSGIDNIMTALPAGSFVISRRGMDALERATQEFSDKRNFQLGGLVTGGPVGDIVGDLEGGERTSRFDLVLNVNGNERRFPLYGTKDTVDELATELERQNLVRL